MSPFKGNTWVILGGVYEMINIDQMKYKGRKEILFMEIWETW